MISVIVPIYNAQSYLEACLRSILNQTFIDFEVICVNDGSTDLSKQIVKDLSRSDSRIILYSQENKGRSSARNLGIEKSSGEYICFVDADDEIPPNSLELLYTSIIRDQSDASIGSISVDYDIHHEYKDCDSFSYTIKREGKYRVTDSIIESCHWSSCAVLFKRAIINQYKLRYPNGLNYEDAYWHWVYFPLCKSITFIKEPVYSYIRRPDSIMSQTFENKEQLAIQHLYIFEKIYDFYLSKGLLQKREEAVLRLLESFFWLSIKYSPKFEKSLSAYICAKILRKMNLPLEGFGTLKKIKEGELEFLYQSDGCERYFTPKELRVAKAVLDLINNVFPKGSVRRRSAVKVARTLIKLKRLLAKIQ